MVSIILEICFEIVWRVLRQCFETADFSSLSSFPLLKASQFKLLLNLYNNYVHLLLLYLLAVLCWVVIVNKVVSCVAGGELASAVLLVPCSLCCVRVRVCNTSPLTVCSSTMRRSAALLLLLFVSMGKSLTHSLTRPGEKQWEPQQVKKYWSIFVLRCSRSTASPKCMGGGGD